MAQAAGNVGFLDLGFGVARVRGIAGTQPVTEDVEDFLARDCLTLDFWRDRSAQKPEAWHRDPEGAGRLAICEPELGLDTFHVQHNGIPQNKPDRVMDLRNKPGACNRYIAMRKDFCRLRRPIAVRQTVPSMCRRVKKSGLDDVS